jgi:hypothetical protein
MTTLARSEDGKGSAEVKVSRGGIRPAGGQRVGRIPDVQVTTFSKDCRGPRKVTGHQELVVPGLSVTETGLPAVGGYPASVVDCF